MWSPLCSCTNKSTPAPSLHLIQNSKQGIVFLFKLAYFRTIVGHKLSHMKRSRQELTREDQSRLTLSLFPQGQRGNHHHVRDKEEKWTQQLMIEHRAMSWCGHTTNIHALHFTSESAFDPSNNIITTKICFVNYKNTIFTFTSFFTIFERQSVSKSCPSDANVAVGDPKGCPSINARHLSRTDCPTNGVTGHKMAKCQGFINLNGSSV